MTKVEPVVEKLLLQVFKFAGRKKVKLYIVGGYLRDALLGREKNNPDIDFCLKNKAINFGRALAGDLKCGFVVLDIERGCCRLVKKIGDKIYTLDFADFRGKTLEDDLLHRDFTINSMALDLQRFLGKENLADALIDPWGAKSDLKKKIIRIVNKLSFDEDPLRILRAFSLSAIFGFKIDPPTLRLCAAKRKKIEGVSFERIRDELFKIFNSTCAWEMVKLLDKLKILELIMPEINVMRGVNQGPYHHLNVWEHSLETLRQLELLLPQAMKNKDIEEYLKQIISAERNRLSLIKLAALLHDIGKPAAKRKKEGKLYFHGHERVGRNIAKAISQRLKLSNDELEAMGKIIFWHLRPGYLADNAQLSARAKFRYFRDTQNEAISTLLVSLSDQRSTRGVLTTKQSRLSHENTVAALIKEHYRKQKEKKLPRLLNGDELMAKFKLPSSPLIGKILREVEELQAIGKVKTKEQALIVARKLVKYKI